MIAGLAIFGVIAAIASSASERSSRPRQRAYERGYDPRYDDRCDPRYEQRNDDRYAPRRGGTPGSEAAAADACAWAAESRAGGESRVDRIGSVTREGDGWRVAGSVTRPAPDAYAVREQFSCVYRAGQVETLDISGGQ